MKNRVFDNIQYQKMIKYEIMTIAIFGGLSLLVWSQWDMTTDTFTPFEVLSILFAGVLFGIVIQVFFNSSYIKKTKETKGSAK